MAVCSGTAVRLEGCGVSAQSIFRSGMAVLDVQGWAVWHVHRSEGSGLDPAACLAAPFPSPSPSPSPSPRGMWYFLSCSARAAANSMISGHWRRARLLQLRPGRTPVGSWQAIAAPSHPAQNEPQKCVCSCKIASITSCELFSSVGDLWFELVGEVRDNCLTVGVSV